jgi:predicted phage-related endonuclease
VFGEKYGCPRALFYDKTGVVPDYQHSEASLDLFERGHALEPLIADRFVAEKGLSVRRMPARVSKDRPWMRVNVDRIILTFDQRGPGYLECKTANEHVFADMLAHGMPEHYVLQAQHGLAVTGWEWGMFAVLEPYTFRFLCFEFKRNEQLISIIQHVEEEFWQMVKAGKIPAALEDFNDERCSGCGYRRGCRNAEALPKTPKVKRFYAPDDSEELDILVGNIKQIGASIEDLRAQQNLEREKLKVWMGNREAVLCQSQGKKIAFAMKNGALTWDGKALDVEHPELAANYKRRGEARRELRMYDATEADD